MSKKQERQERLIKCLNFASGNTECDAPQDIAHFINARSRVRELYQIKQLKRKMKFQAITCFINLPRPERAKLIESNEQLIIALPSDCDTLGISRPKPVRYQSSNFGGKSVEYGVFSILEVIRLWSDLETLKQGWENFTGID